MQIPVLYFARAREIAGRDEEMLEVADGATVGEAFGTLVDRYPALADERSALRFAIDAAFVGADVALTAGSTLVLIPPVGGG